MDKELKRILKYKVGKFSPQDVIKREDVEKIYDLTINNRSISGKELNISLSGIEYLSNLNMLTLSHFRLSDQIIQILNSLPQLKTLQLNGCSFDNVTEMLANSNLRDLIISETDFFDISSCVPPEILQIIHCKNVELNVENNGTIRKLYIRNSNVNNTKVINRFNKLEKVVFEGCQLDDETSIKNLKDQGIVSLIEEKWLPTK